MSYASLWRSRPEGERRAIAIGGAMLAVLLVIVLAWLPLERTRTRLSADLPRLRASVAQLRRDAAEVKRLRAIVPTVSTNSTPLSSLATQAPLAGAQVSVPDEKHVRVAAADIGFSALLQWLVTVQSTQSLRVESAKIDALAAPGRVHAELTLSKS